MAEEDKDSSYSEFKPEFHSSMKEPEEEKPSDLQTKTVENPVEVSEGTLTPGRSNPGVQVSQQSEMDTPSTLIQTTEPEKSDADISYSEFNPKAHSTLKEPNIEGDKSQTKVDGNTPNIFDLNESYKDFKPQHHSSMEENRGEKGSPTGDKTAENQNRLNDSDLNYSNFKPEHHSSINEPRRDVNQPCGGEDPDPELSPADMSRIVQETDEFLNQCLKKVMEQEKRFTSLAYRIYNMYSDVRVYETLVDQQSRFISNYNSVFQVYHSKLLELLSPFGDFQLDSQQNVEIVFENLSNETEEDIKSNIVNKGYGHELFLRGQNMLVGHFSRHIPDRLLAITRFREDQALRLRLFEDSVSQLRKLSNEIIQLKTKLHFFMIGW